MTDELLGAKLLSIVSAFRAELKPELQSPNAKLRGELVDMLLSRLAIEVDGDPSIDAAADGYTEIVRNENKWRGEIEDKIAETMSMASVAKTSANELAIPAERITGYLRKKRPEYQSVKVEKVTTIPGGRSKGTILVDLSEGTRNEQIVLRKDFGASVAGTSVVDEFPIIQAVYAAGVKAPKPLWLEEDPDALGGCFIAFDRVPGKAMGTLFTSEASPSFAKEFAATLASLHKLDIDKLNIRGSFRWAGEENPVLAMLDSFEARYESSVPQNRLMDTAYAWLREKLPTIGAVRGFVHGDAGLHNALGQNDELTALLDWEFAHAGDPAEDLAYCKFLMQRILPWSDFMDAYHAAGGQEVSPARMEFFAVWRTLHLSTLTGAAQRVFNSGQDRDLRVAAIGYNTFPKQLRDLAADLDVAMRAS